jgi:hypothetical protein
VDFGSVAVAMGFGFSGVIAPVGVKVGVFIIGSKLETEFLKPTQ